MITKKRRYLFTSESVSEGHPDKVCDQVSDALLDAFLEKDPNSRVAIECFTKTGFIVVGGEVTSKSEVDIQYVVRETLKEIGYDDPKYGFDGNTCGVIISLSNQSSDIAKGINALEKNLFAARIMPHFTINTTKARQEETIAQVVESNLKRLPLQYAKEFVEFPLVL